MPRPDPVAAERWARHGLADRPDRAVVNAVRRTTAVQAQDTAASYLGVRARMSGVTRDDVVAAVEIERSVVRTWLLRGTIHLIAASDLRWLVRLVGPNVQRKYRTRWRQLGLTDDVLDASVAALPEILAGGPQDRHQIRAALAERDVAASPDPQLTVHILAHACTSGLVCRGPDRGRDATFVLVDDWVPDAADGPSGDDALAELARRYFAAYSPATPADFTAWSGFGATRAIELIRDELTDADVAGRPGLRLGEVEPVRGLRLLPAFDNYVLGYRDRASIVAEAEYGEVYQGGMIRPVLVIDGQAVGTWRLERQRGSVVVTAWRELRPGELRALQRETADVGRFLNADLGLQLDGRQVRPR